MWCWVMVPFLWRSGSSHEDGLRGTGREEVELAQPRWRECLSGSSLQRDDPRGALQVGHPFLPGQGDRFLGGKDAAFFREGIWVRGELVMIQQRGMSGERIACSSWLPHALRNLATFPVAASDLSRVRRKTLGTSRMRVTLGPCSSIMTSRASDTSHGVRYALKPKNMRLRTGGMRVRLPFSV